MLALNGAGKRALLTVCAVVTSLAGSGEAPQGQSPPGARVRVRILKRSTAYRLDPRLQEEHRLKPRHERVDAPDAEPRYLARIEAQDLPKLEQPGMIQPVRIMRCEVVKADEILKALGAATSVPFAMQSEWAGRWVVLPQRSYSGSYLMDLLSTAFDGRWHTDGERWVLAEDESIAQLAALSDAEYLELKLSSTRKLMQSITARQWERLASGGIIQFNELSSVQARALLEDIRINRYGPGRRTRTPTRGAMRGQGVFLVLVGSGRDATLDIGVPWEPYFGVIERNQPRHSISFFGDNGELAWGVPPPR